MSATSTRCFCRVVSGVIDYWDGSSYAFPKDTVKFKFKMDTDMYALAKAKTTAPSIEVRPGLCALPFTPPCCF